MHARRMVLPYTLDGLEEPLALDNHLDALRACDSARGPRLAVYPSAGRSRAACTH